MAQIRVEKTHSSSWIWWLLGLILLALIIWAVVEVMDRDEVEVGAVAPVPVAIEPVGPPVEAPALDEQTLGIPAAQIIGDPAAWDGRTVTGEARVIEVVSDRGFWVDVNGQRIFALLNEVPGEIKEINSGQTIQMNGATVHETGDLSGIPDQMDPQAREIASAQSVVLAVDSKDVNILSTPRGSS